ncbi:MAG: adenylate/guanylate cyclase domain-containing protein [Alphaproteobacteria bacterium]|nr:adenylate/guanylate cyclase domain-containing protein [Alphaproteobacteria bacterium]
MSASDTPISRNRPGKHAKPANIRITKRGLRLGSGLILFAFVCSHLANHALGLVSLDTLEAGHAVFAAVWQNPLSGGIVVLAMTVHVCLALHAVYSRRKLKMRFGEAAQLLLGFAAPILLVSHILGTRVAELLFDTSGGYLYVVMALWVDSPMHGIRQTAATLVVWIHASIGLYYWLHLKPWFTRWAPWLFGIVLLLPVLSLLGFVSAGRAINRLLQEDPGLRVDIAIDAGAPVAAEIAFLYRLEQQIFVAIAVMIVLVLVARAIRIYIASRAGIVNITYPEGRSASVPPGTTILEASQLHDIPHAAVCGGRGRCSTCRVRINGPLERLPQPDDSELKVLRRVGAAPDVRLACQTRPTEDLSVTPLLPPNASPRDGFAKSAAMQGQEQEIAILFADIRGFTTFSEQKLPYDVVFLLNRYFRSMGEAIEKAGGRVDKFIGDGIMALFGIDGNPRDGARAGLNAAVTMSECLDELNQLLDADLPEPLRIGIGIHAGPAIVGEMGYGRAISVTAIGDTVNTSSRLEAKTKDFRAQLIVSQHLADVAGLDTSLLRKEQIEVRGRKEPMDIVVLDDAKELRALLDQTPVDRRAAAPIPQPAS